MASAASTTGAHSPTAAAWVVLAVCLMLTLIAWHAALGNADDNAARAFASRAKEIESAIRARMLAYEQVLRGGIGLFRASREVERHEWRAYVAALKIEENYPGTVALGYSQRISHADKESHIEMVRGQGFADYTIQPEGEREDYFPIVFIEPFNERNRRAFGYDMFSETVRRQAMAQARDNAVTVISNKVVLVQESAQNAQPAVLMYLPLYRAGETISTVEERRQALQGYVHGAFRVGDLMRGILSAHAGDITVEIYDGQVTSPESLLFRTVRNNFDPAFTDHREIEIEGRTWTLRFASQPAFEAALDRQLPPIILASGIIISFAVFAALWALAGARVRAVRLADRMTAALRKSEQRSRLIVDTAHEAFIAIDSQGCVCDWNKQAETTLGWTREEAMGREFAELSIPERDREAHRKGLARFLQTGEGPLLGKRIELSALHRNGREFPVEITITTLHAEGDFVFNAFLHDISARREAERAIRVLNADLESRALQLEASNKELESFSYSVSHDLRAPLRAVDGFSRILQEDYGAALNPEGRRILSLIREGSRKMGQLIDDLLAFSRLGRQSITASHVDMEQLVREVFGELNAPNIRFTLHPIPIAWGDRRLLKQVWVNLLANAIKFSSGKSAPAIEAGGKNDGRQAIYHVTDNGVGFDMRYHEKLFGVFQRLHLDSEFPGTGVGLAIVQRIITRHGGRVWAESTSGAGATFYFALPAAEGEHRE
jgi:PAS domain S-box-containing protein